jgi:hypothetical protein
VLAILDNTTTAMTGFQPVPHEGTSPKVTIEGIVKGIGVPFLEIADPYDIKNGIALVKKAYEYSRANKTPAVIIFRHPCVTKTRFKGHVLPSIDKSCKNCRICYEKFECPALYEDKAAGRAAVNESLLFAVRCVPRGMPVRIDQGGLMHKGIICGRGGQGIITVNRMPARLRRASDSKSFRLKRTEWRCAEARSQPTSRSAISHRPRSATAKPTS